MSAFLVQCGGGSGSSQAEEEGPEAQVRVELSMGKDDSLVVTLTGKVPSEADRQTLVTAAQGISTTTGGALEESLAVDPAVSNAGWVKGIAQVLPNLTEAATQGFSLDADGGALTIAGSLATEEEKSKIAREVLDALSGSVQLVDNRLSVSPPSQKDARLRVTSEDGSELVAEGLVNDEETKQAFLKVLSESGWTKTTPVSDKIKVKDYAQPLQFPADLATYLKTFFKSPQLRRFRMEGTTVVIEGQVPTDEAKSLFEFRGRRMFPVKEYRLMSAFRVTPLTQAQRDIISSKFTLADVADDTVFGFTSNNWVRDSQLSKFKRLAAKIKSSDSGVVVLSGVGGSGADDCSRAAYSHLVKLGVPKSRLKVGKSLGGVVPSDGGKRWQVVCKVAE